MEKDFKKVYSNTFNDTFVNSRYEWIGGAETPDSGFTGPNVNFLWDSKNNETVGYKDGSQHYAKRTIELVKDNVTELLVGANYRSFAFYEESNPFSTLYTSNTCVESTTVGDTVTNGEWVSESPITSIETYHTGGVESGELSEEAYGETIVQHPSPQNFVSYQEALTRSVEPRRSRRSRSHRET